MKLIAVVATLQVVTAMAISIKNDLPKPKLASATGAIALSVLTITTPALPATAAAGGDILAGEQIFSANCAACHAGGQNVIMPEKTLQKEALEQYLAGGRNQEAIINQVTNGKNAMPAFGGRLSEDDIANAASYVMYSSENDWGRRPIPVEQEPPTRSRSSKADRREQKSSSQNDEPTLQLLKGIVPGSTAGRDSKSSTNGDSTVDALEDVLERVKTLSEENKALKKEIQQLKQNAARY